MAVPAFDPLVDLDGLWTTALADRFLPDPQLPSASYESLNGRLFVSPTEVHTNSALEPFPMRFDLRQLLP